MEDLIEGELMALEEGATAMVVEKGAVEEEGED